MGSAIQRLFKLLAFYRTCAKRNMDVWAVYCYKLCWAPGGKCVILPYIGFSIFVLVGYFWVVPR